MFKSLRLQDFQSHSDTYLDLDPHFNCFSGSGHSGKTAVVRALNLLLYNEWDSSWVTFGKLHCTITAVLQDNTILTRQKGEKLNKYKITYPEGKIQMYENFGTTIPEEIQKVLKIFVVPLAGGDKIKLNLHTQFGSSSILDLSSSNKARLFGKLTGLDILDGVGQNLAVDKKSLQVLAKVKEEELILTGVKVQELNKYMMYRPQLEEVRGQLELVGSRLDQLKKLKELQAQIKIWQKNHTELVDKLVKVSQIKEVSFNSVENSLGQLIKLKDLKFRVDQFKTRHLNLTSRFKSCPTVDHLDMDQPLIQLKQLDQLKSLQRTVRDFKTKHSRVKVSLQNVDTALNQSRKQYIEQLKQVGKCPTCLSPLTDKCLDDVLTEL